MADANAPFPGAQETLVTVRDRLFHTLFFKFSLAYARGCNATGRRIIETLILLKAIICFSVLVYVHLAFARHPVQCLEDVKTTWPRDGILRVEIIRNPPESYSLKDSYEKERKLQAIQRQNEELAIFGIFSDSHYDDFRYDLEGEAKADESEQELIQETGEESDNTTIVINKSTTDIEEDLKADPNNLPDDFLTNPNVHVPDPSEWLEEAKKINEENKKNKNYVIPEEDYIVEYSLEYGFLRLSPATRQRLNLTVQLLVLDPDKNSCFRDSFSQLMLENFLGYEDVLMSSVKSLAEHEESKGYLRNVVTGAHYHFVSKWTSSTSYFTAAIVMTIFTISITMLLRYSQHQIFIFIVELLQMLEFNTALTFPAAPLLTVILALVGMEAIMSEFFDDTTTAFYIILIVWVADQYDAICCHTNMTKKFWLRFFYLYHFSFYAYHYRFSGQYSTLALLTMWLFTLHSMVYFFHHYELPLIIQQAQLQDILMRNQEAGGPPIRITQHITSAPTNNNNNNNAVNRNVTPTGTVQGLRRMAAFNIAGLRFRFGIVFTTTTTTRTVQHSHVVRSQQLQQQQLRPNANQNEPENIPTVAEENTMTAPQNVDTEVVEATSTLADPTQSETTAAASSRLDEAAMAANEAIDNLGQESPRESSSDTTEDSELAQVVSELREVSEALKSMTSQQPRPQQQQHQDRQED